MRVEFFSETSLIEKFFFLPQILKTDSRSVHGLPTRPQHQRTEVTATQPKVLRPVHWRDGNVVLIDQTRLPHEEVWLELSEYTTVVNAIRDMRVRGAPAIGIAGAFAMALAAREALEHCPSEPQTWLDRAAEQIRSARPTAVNLAWAVDRMLELARGAGIAEIPSTLADAAVAIQEADEAANRSMGLHGAALFPPASKILTHCNTGALATGGYGTALGIIHTAWEQGRVETVFATETRPLLQGARLTAWELSNAGIDTTLIADSAAGHLMSRGGVDAVIVGADRIAANGDVANKIGTYSLAVLAKENDLPLYVAAPISTIDLGLASGDLIPIESRPPEELTHVGGRRVAASGVAVSNPAFDVTPSRYVTAIVTETGVLRSPYGPALEGAVGASSG